MATKVCPSCVIDFVNCADVGMIQRRCGFGLAPEMPQGPWLVSHILGQEFQSYESPESEVFRLVHDSHFAAAQLFQEMVMRNGLARHLERFFAPAITS